MADIRPAVLGFLRDRLFQELEPLIGAELSPETFGRIGDACDDVLASIKVLPVCGYCGEPSCVDWDIQPVDQTTVKLTVRTGFCLCRLRENYD